MYSSVEVVFESYSCTYGTNKDILKKNDSLFCSSAIKTLAKSVTAWMMLAATRLQLHQNAAAVEAAKKGEVL